MAHTDNAPAGDTSKDAAGRNATSSQAASAQRDADARAEAVGAGLRALADVEAPASLWIRTLSQLSRRERAHTRRQLLYGLAATLALVIGVSSLMRKPDGDRPDTTLGELVAESRDTEQLRRNLDVSFEHWNETQLVLAARIADVDGELFELGATPDRTHGGDRSRMQHLWTTRVDLMRALAEEERLHQTPYVY